MKTIKSLLALTAVSMVVSGCNDLSQEPFGSYVTQGQKEQILEDNPDMAAASVNALPQMVSVVFGLYPDSNHHGDFGWPSLMLVLDSRGMDMPSDLLGYNWYSAALEMSDFGGTYFDNLFMWRTNYNLINSSNAVIGLIDPEVDNSELQYFRGQGLAYRAWCYSNLAQMYQFTYVKNPQAPTVPLILDTNLEEAGENGCARATGEEIYTQIKADLTEAIALLDKAQAAGVSRSSMATGSNVKTFVNQAVCYGLRARVNLITQSYAQAAADAEMAIQLATKEGITPYSVAEASVPAFYDINDHNCMWGYYQDPSGNGTALVGWGGQMVSWHANYPGVGVYRRINASLYEQIPTNDVRKGWWLNGSGVAATTLPSQYREWMANTTANKVTKLPPYCNTKFGAYSNTPGGNVWAEDTPLMRIEEMYLMLAEAQGASDLNKGKQTLNNFVNTYRQQNYNCTAGSFEEFLDQIWFQRRIELWGEGFSYYDMMRFQKPLDRRGGGFDPATVYNLSPENPVLLFEIITDEAQNNPLIGNVSNGASIPEPVEDIK